MKRIIRSLLFYRVLLTSVTCLAIFEQLYAIPTDTVLVADLTFKVNGISDFYYAFAEGETVFMEYHPLVGNGLKFISFSKHPDGQALYSDFNPDSVKTSVLPIAETGIYQLQLKEKGAGSKLCRVVLRKIQSKLYPQFNNNLSWNAANNPAFTLDKTSKQVGKNTEIHSLGGSVVVSANKFGFKSPKNVYRFSLPNQTARWAVRISVGQEGNESRKKDNEQLSLEIKKASTKLFGIEPTTGLAAFALGMSIDMMNSKSGEDVSYDLLDEANAQLFLSAKPYKSFFTQTGISVDAQRFENINLPSGLAIALKSDNFLDDINVTVDIEAIVETPIIIDNWYLSPIK